MKGKVLIVAGSDSGGGAGIQADLKTLTALGGYGMTAITALTAQNTLGVHGVLGIDPAFVIRQIEVVLEDLGVDCVKTGMLHSVPVIAAVVEGLSKTEAPLVVDPVMIAKGGASLLDPDSTDLLKRGLISRATVLTPNAPEAEALTGRRIATLDDMRRAADDLLTLGAKTVVLKGGHVPGAVVHDLVEGEAGSFVLESPRIATSHTHGTGCTLASAIAAGIAQGMGLKAAIERARAYVIKAIETAPGFGRGHGPLNHAHTVRDLG